MLGMIPDFCLAMCGERQISFQGIQAPGDDEFVYQSTSDYLNAVERENVIEKEVTTTSGSNYQTPAQNEPLTLEPKVDGKDAVTCSVIDIVTKS